MPPVAVKDGVHLTLVAGDYEDKKGPLKNFSPITAIWGNIEAGKEVTLTATRDYWTLLYVIDGKIKVNGTEAGPYHLVVFDKEDEQSDVHITALENTRLLYLCAEPIDEPVAAKDNFVMNTSAEIDQAMEDYRNGLFGKLEQ